MEKVEQVVLEVLLVDLKLLDLQVLMVHQVLQEQTD